MNSIKVNNNILSLTSQDTETDIPFTAHDLGEMLCFAETFLQQQTPEGQEPKSGRYFSVLTSEIQKSQNLIEIDFFCEALEAIASEMGQFLPAGYDRFESERLGMEFLQLSANDLKGGKVGDLYILSSEKNEDRSTSLSMALSSTLRDSLLNLYDGDPQASVDVMLSSVLSQVLEDFIRDKLTEKNRSDNCDSD